MPWLQAPKDDVDHGDQHERQPDNSQDTLPPRPKGNVTKAVRSVPRGEGRSRLAAFKGATHPEFFLVGFFHTSGMARLVLDSNRQLSVYGPLTFKLTH